jgi:hypothetical protein
MKTQIKNIKIIELPPSSGGTGAPTGPPPPPPQWGDPENVIKLPPEDDIPEDPTEDENNKKGEGKSEEEYERVEYPGKGVGTFNPGEILPVGALGDPGGDEGIEDDKPISAEDIEQMWDSSVKTAGDMPASIRRALAKLKKPVINWKEELERYIDQAISKTKYDLPSRRFLAQGEAQYGYKSYKVDFENVVVAIDTSGSINRDMIEQFLSEVIAIGESYSPEKTIVLYCDTKVYEPDIIEPGEKPDFSKIAGGGGTNFWPPFKWVEKNMIDQGEAPTVFIYFTDGIADFPSESDYNIEIYSDRCIWVFLSFNGEPFEGQQPFGERIDIALANKTVTKI